MSCPPTIVDYHLVRWSGSYVSCLSDIVLLLLAFVIVIIQAFYSCAKKCYRSLYILSFSYTDIVVLPQCDEIVALSLLAISLLHHLY